ncbi:MAG: radical SAM protein [Nitrospirota bacterium]
MKRSQTTWLSDKEYLEQFNNKTVRNRVPVTGSLELTSRCNLKCVHCYLGSQRRRDHALKEMNTGRILSILDEVTEAGCLRFLITGGEPLSRKDFPEIYRHAKENGLLVTVFTNGTLITEMIAEIFEDLPPQAVEISLYGATAETYEKITRVKGSYGKCMDGIEQLLKRNINLHLKTVLMSLNKHELYAMEGFARECGVRFRFDAAIFPCFNGDMTPLTFRVQPQEAVEKEFSDSERLRHWKEYFERAQKHTIPDTLYNCGAGVISFHVDSDGNLSPCLMTSSPKYDLLRGRFTEGWDNITHGIREKKTGADFACAKCNKRSLCGFCPAFFGLENGAEDICSEYLCAIGENRFKILALNGVTNGTQ